MSKISAAMVEHQVPVQPLMRLQRGRWSLESAMSLRIFNDGIDWSSHMKSDGHWVMMTEPPPDPFEGHTGFWIDVDGEGAHVLGDPNMSEETAKALAEVIRAVRKNYPEEPTE